MGQIRTADPDDPIVDYGDDIELGRIRLDETAGETAGETAETPVEEDAAPSKKKGNTMLIVAAAGLGALVMMRK